MTRGGWLLVGAVVSACGEPAAIPSGRREPQGGVSTSSGGSAGTDNTVGGSTSGGSVGTDRAGGGGGDAASDGGGKAGAEGIACGTARPPWLPLGVFEPTVEAFALAKAAWVDANCCAFYCFDAASSSGYQSCLRPDFLEVVPSPQWLACASRAVQSNAKLSAWLEDTRDAFRRLATACSAAQCSTGTCPEGSIDPPPTLSLPECPKSHQNLCADHATWFLPCNGVEDCADGYDELNCDPSAGAYACGNGEQVSWLALCDGRSDCSDASDERNCALSD